MKLLRRVLARIDANLEGSVERHLRLAGIPEPRSVSPDEVIAAHLPSRFRVASGPYPCCAECQVISPIKCEGPHWTPCPAGDDCEPWDESQTWPPSGGAA